MTRKKEGVVPRVSNAGHQDIWMTKYKTFSVTIIGENIGTFKDIEKAIKARDDFRKENNLPAAKY